MCVLTGAPGKCLQPLLKFALCLDFVRQASRLDDSRRGCEPVPCGVPGHILLPAGWGSGRQSGADAVTAAAAEPGKGLRRRLQDAWGLPGHGHHLAAGGLKYPWVLWGLDVSTSGYPWLQRCSPLVPSPAASRLDAPCSIVSGQGGDISSANKTPSPKLLCCSKPTGIQAASLCVPAQGHQWDKAHFVASPRKQAGFCTLPLIPWDVFFYPFEVERVSLVNRQADDFGNFKGMDGSEVEPDAENRVTDPSPRQEQPRAGAQEAEVSARSGACQPCPTRPTNFKALASSFCHVRILL